jgi:hypothetical protein
VLVVWNGWAWNASYSLDVTFWGSGCLAGLREETMNPLFALVLALSEFLAVALHCCDAVLVPLVAEKCSFVILAVGRCCR